MWSSRSHFERPRPCKPLGVLDSSRVSQMTRTEERGALGDGVQGRNQGEVRVNQAGSRAAAESRDRDAQRTHSVHAWTEFLCVSSIGRVILSEETSRSVWRRTHEAPSTTRVEIEHAAPAAKAATSTT